MYQAARLGVSMSGLIRRQIAEAFAFDLHFDQMADLGLLRVA
jgi:hypothetical protein